MNDLFSNLFIIMWLLIAICFDSTGAKYPRAFLKPVLRPIRWLGLSYSWRLFAPNPTASDKFVFVRVIMHDGSRQDVDVSHPQGFLAQFRWIRYRKFYSKLGIKSRRPSSHQFREYGICRWVVTGLRREGRDPFMVQIIEVRQPVAPLDATDRVPRRSRERMVYVTTFDSVAPT